MATSTRNRQTTTHPEAPEGEKGDEFKSGLTSEADYTVQSGLLQAQIRTQKLHQQTHQLRGEKAKVQRKKLWADTEEVKAKTQEVKLGIEQDNHAGVVKERVVNQDSITQRLANKSYKADIQRRQNDGLRQSILNSGSQVSVDHTTGFSGVTGSSAKEQK